MNTLSTSLLTLSYISLLLIIYSLFISGLSSIITTLNLLLSIITFKLILLLSYTISLYIYSLFISILLLLFTLPILTTSFILILLDILFFTIYYSYYYGGDSILYQHLFWFFAHPEVYILILPSFSIISINLSSTIYKLLFSLLTMILTIISISLLGSLVWLHHLYTLGLDIDTHSYFTLLTIFISIPTGTKLFNYSLTIFNYLLFIIFNLFIHYLYLLLLYIMFTLGGSSGIILSNSIIDYSLHDSYYIITHFHYILSLTSLLSYSLLIIFIRLFIYGFNLLSFIHSIISLSIYHLLIYTFNLTFYLLHFTGFNYLSRRIIDYITFINTFTILSTLSSLLTIFILITYYILKKIM